MNIEHKREMIRAVIIALLILALIVGFTVKAGNATQKEPPAENTAYTEEPTQETQATTEPATITIEETEPTQETEQTTATTEPPAATETPTPTEAKPVETKPANPETTYTEDELEMLAIVIYREAGGNSCSDETRLMVGTVVMNRIQDKRFPNTMKGVLTQKSQYGRMHWTGVVWPKRASNPGEAHAVERDKG